MKMGIVYIAKYILRSEYQCRCCSQLPPNYDEPYDLPFDALFSSFEIIREEWGAPLYISSGYRCPLHNSFVGGHPLSTHQFGLAFDVKVEPHEIDKLHEIVLEETPDLRVGKYSNYLHLDAGYLIYPRASEAWVKGHRWSNT